MNNADILEARARYYEFFSYAFFFHGNDEKGFLRWQEQAKILSSIKISDECDFSAILGVDFQGFKDEQNSVLFDFSYANVPLNASFYDEGRDNGAMLIRTIAILKDTKYRRNIEKCAESEDFIGFLFLMMSVFLRDEKNGDFNTNESAKNTFEQILNPCIDEFCELLCAHKDSVVFKALGEIIKIFIDLERANYAIKAPKPKEISVAKEAMNMRPHVSKMPTAKSKLNWDEFTKL